MPTSTPRPTRRRQLMRWDQFLQRRRERRGRATATAAAFRGAEGLTETSLAGWACARHPALRQLVDEAIRSAPPRPSMTWVRAALAHESDLRMPAVEDADVAERLHRRRIRASTGPEDELAWMFDELAFLGEQVERVEREAWRQEPVLPAAEDRAIAALWRGWFEHRWVDEGAWNRALLPHATRSFRGVMEAARVPHDSRDRVVADLFDGFYFQMLGASGAVPGWLEVATRLVEATGPEPIQALAAILDPSGWIGTTRCAARRGGLAETVARLFPERIETEARASGLRAWTDDNPSRVEAVVDLHVLLRLIDTWSEAGSGDPRGNWAIVTQNRGRVRGRLRAVVFQGPRERVARAVLTADALTARTAAAVRRYAWAWAWQQVEHHFDSVGGAVEVTPPCVPPPKVAEFDADATSAASTWVLMMALRGQLATLERWVYTGTAQQGDTTLYRYLSENLPDVLRDTPSSGRSSYHRLRTWLADALPAVLDTHLAVLADIAGEVPDRATRARVTGRLRSSWHPAVELPRAGFPTIIENAAAALAWVVRADADEGQ